MSLKDTWADKTNTTTGLDGDDILAEDINAIAKEVIEQGEKLDKIPDELDKKVDAEAGKGLSSNDFTDEYKEKLDDIQGELVQSDWEQNDEAKLDYIKNRPFYKYFEQDDDAIQRDFYPDKWQNYTVEPNVWLIPDNTYTAIVKAYLNGNEVYTETLSAKAYTILSEEYTLEFESETSSMFVEGYYRLSDKYQRWCIDFDVNELNFEYDQITLNVNGDFNILKFKQIDERFIPDTIATKDYVKKYVDENSGSISGEFEMDYEYVDGEIAKLKRYADETFVKKTSGGTGIVNTATGEAIKLTDSAYAPIEGLVLYGKTTQAGTPTPSNPQDLESVGESVEVTVYKNDNESPATFTVNTPNGLRGIPVTSGGNYTDSNGQRWICDEIDYNRGVYIQRIGEYRNTGAPMACYTTVPNAEKDCIYWNDVLRGIKLKQGFAISNCFTYGWGYATIPYIVGVANDGVANSYLYFSVKLSDTEYGTTYATAKEAVNAWVKKTFSEDNPLIVYYVLETPIETPITEELIEAYTHYPTTTILSDKAGLKIGYVADTKNYIDNKFAQLETALLSIAD